LISKDLLLSKSTDGHTWLSHIMNHLSFGSTPTSIESFHKILTSTNDWKDTFFFSQDGKRLPSTEITDLQLNKFINFCSSVDFKKPPLFFNIHNEKSYFGNIFNFNGATLNLQIPNSRNENLETDLKTIQDHLLNLYLSTVKYQLSGILKNPNSSKSEVFHFPIFNNVLNNTVNQIGTLFTEGDVKKQNLSISLKKISPLIIESIFHYFLSGPATLNRYSYQKVHSFNSHELIFLSAAKHMKFKSEDISTLSQIAKHNLPSALLGEFEKILLANSVKSSINHAPTKSL
jgi:hypothetical protein